MWFNLYTTVLPVLNLFGFVLKGENVPPSTGVSEIISTNQTQMMAMTMPSQEPKIEKLEPVDEGRWLPTRIIGGTIFSFLAVAGIVGNILVIYAIWTDPTIQVQTQLANLGILNLAYTDLMVCLFVSLAGAISISFKYYPLGPYYCKFSSVINLTGIVATNSILSIISLDRFIAVGWSLHYPQYVTYARFQGAMIFIWVACFLCTFFWGFFPTDYDVWAAICDFKWKELGPAVPSAFYYGIFCTIIFCINPAILIIVCNVAIIQMSKEKGIAKKVQDPNAKEAKPESSKANARVLKAMVVVIISFCVLTMPCAVIRAIKVLSGAGGISEHIPGPLTLFTTFLQFIASIVNPLIYGLFRKDFREAYKKIFKQIRRK